MTSTDIVLRAGRIGIKFNYDTDRPRSELYSPITVIGLHSVKFLEMTTRAPYTVTFIKCLSFIHKMSILK